ncbi:MAG TPA: hypothetical protein VHY75_15130 [Steroidobacteraceae bacterium]|jgi:hypothetical protein|nr:hypothetical protein [Steroidobacteraceae bacterium]
MSAPDPVHRDAVVARLAESRAEISRLLEPPSQAGGEAQAPEPHLPGTFPRSRTMQALMTVRGLGAVGALAGGLLVSRPRLVWRLLRVLPTSAVARLVIGRVIAALRGAKP